MKAGKSKKGELASLLGYADMRAFEKWKTCSIYAAGLVYNELDRLSSRLLEFLHI